MLLFAIVNFFYANNFFLNISYTFSKYTLMLTCTVYSTFLTKFRNYFFKIHTDAHLYRPSGWRRSGPGDNQ